MAELFFDTEKPKEIKTKDTKENKSSLKKKVADLADKDGMKPDDPLRLINVAMAEKLDEFDKHIKSYGPDTGRLPAGVRKLTIAAIRAVRESTCA